MNKKDNFERFVSQKGQIFKKVVSQTYELDKLMTYGKENRSILNIPIFSTKKSIKAQLRYANNIKARFALIIGKDEINSNKAKLKPLFINSEEQNVEIDPKIIVNTIKKFQDK